MTNIPNPAQLRTQARPAPDCLPGRHCERHARGLGGCIAGECNRPKPADGVAIPQIGQEKNDA